jgi:AraC family transcriptional regulator
MQIIFDHDDVTIRHVPPTPVAFMEHRGDRAMLGEHLPPVQGLAQGGRLVAGDKPYFHGLPFRKGARGPGRFE